MCAETCLQVMRQCPAVVLSCIVHASFVLMMARALMGCISRVDTAAISELYCIQCMLLQLHLQDRFVCSRGRTHFRSMQHSVWPNPKYIWLPILQCLQEGSSTISMHMRCAVAFPHATSDFALFIRSDSYNRVQCCQQTECSASSTCSCSNGRTSNWPHTSTCSSAMG